MRTRLFKLIQESHTVILIFKIDKTINKKSNRTIKPLKHLNYSLAIELQYLGHMAELDNTKLAFMHIAMSDFELGLMVRGTG